MKTKWKELKRILSRVLTCILPVIQRSITKMGKTRSLLQMVREANPEHGERQTAYEFGNGKKKFRHPREPFYTETFYGDELVSNGGFDSDTIWTKGSGWLIEDGVGRTYLAVGDLSQTISLTEGSTYILSYDIAAYSSGTLVPILGGTVGTFRGSEATFTENIVAGSGGSIVFSFGASFAGDIDNVSIIEVFNP